MAQTPVAQMSVAKISVNLVSGPRDGHDWQFEKGDVVDRRLLGVDREFVVGGLTVKIVLRYENLYSP